MRKLQPIVPAATLKTIYSSLVYSHLTYAIEVWGKSSPSSVDQIKHLQNKCIKMLRINQNASLDDTYKEINLMPFDKIHKFFTLTRFHKYMNNPNYFLYDQLSSQQIYHQHNTRFTSNNNYTTPSVQLSKYYSCFTYQSIKLYNELPISIKNSNSCLLYTSPSPRDKRQSRMPSSA